jgi:exodeoxyribonuclease VII small subunit
MKKKNDLAEDKNEQSFEKSFKRLEEILSKLENEFEDYSLEEIIKNYQEGLQLLKTCREKLGEAELKIKKINTEEEN